MRILLNMSRTVKRKKRALIADLPPGVGISRSKNGVGSIYYRVRLGKKFTGGKPVKRDFTKLEDAQSWLQGEAPQNNTPSVSTAGIVALKENAGSEIFASGAKSLHEALDAVRRCREIGITITEAVDYATKYLRPCSSISSAS